MALTLFSLIYTVVTAWSFALVGDYVGKYSYSKYFSALVYTMYFLICVKIFALPIYPSVLAVIFCYATCYFTRFPRFSDGTRANLQLLKSKKKKKKTE